LFSLRSRTAPVTFDNWANDEKDKINIPVKRVISFFMKDGEFCGSGIYFKSGLIYLP